MLGFEHIDRQTLLYLLETCDEDTNRIFKEDYIPNWDKKSLWNVAPPLVLIVDTKLVSIMFYNYVTISDTTGEKVLYIQRTYTVPEFRGKGYFKQLVKAVISKSFNFNCRSLYMFCDVDFINAWKKLFFVPLCKTTDQKYFLVSAPILCADIEDSNIIFQKTTDPQTAAMPLKYFTSEFLLFFKGTIAKYCK